MSSSDLTLGPWTPRAIAMLRIVTAFLFIQHGTAKLFGLPHLAMFDGLEVLSLRGIAGMLEIVGGPLLLAGLFTRSIAFVLSGLMAFAYFIGHATWETFFSPILNHGESAVLFCFIFLLFAAAGPGTWSVDAARGARSFRGISKRSMSPE